jgi:hypothetical protein
MICIKLIQDKQKPVFVEKKNIGHQYQLTLITGIFNVVTKRRGSNLMEYSLFVYFLYSVHPVLLHAVFPGI